MKVVSLGVGLVKQIPICGNLPAKGDDVPTLSKRMTHSIFCDGRSLDRELMKKIVRRIKQAGV